MEDFEVADLIYKYLRRELTDDERKGLNTWLTANESNKLLFDKICDKKQILQKAHVFDRHHSSKAWKQLNDRISPKRKLSFWYKCAAIIVLPLFIGGIFYASQQVFIKESEQAVAELHEIRPGQRGATVRLADGRVLDLQHPLKDSLDGGLLLVNMDGVLHYNVDDRKQENEKLRYNEVITPRGGEYSIVLPDGTKVWLNTESSLRFPVVFEKNRRVVYVKGELYFDVTPDKNRPFLVVSDQSVVEVMGTKFNVRAYADRPHVTTLISGKVNLKCENQNVYLKPGQQAILCGGAKKIRVSEVDVSSFIAWKEGRFLFDDVALEDIMNELSRWYDVEIFFTNDTIRKEHFSIELKRHENFEEVMKLIEQTGVVKLEVKNRVVIIK